MNVNHEITVYISFYPMQKYNRKINGKMKQMLKRQISFGTRRSNMLASGNRSLMQLLFCAKYQMPYCLSDVQTLYYNHNRISKRTHGSIKKCIKSSLELPNCCSRRIRDQKKVGKFVPSCKLKSGSVNSFNNSAALHKNQIDVPSHSLMLVETRGSVNKPYEISDDLSNC